MNTLSTLLKGDTGVIKAVKGIDSIRRKVVDLGIVPGMDFEIFTVTPKSAMVIILDGNRVIVDLKTCENIVVR